MKASLDCKKITDYFNIDLFIKEVDNNNFVRSTINKSIGIPDEKGKIAPLLQKLYTNAQSNANKASPQGYRHVDTIKNFSGSLLCLIGAAGYDLLHANFGCALPHISTVRKMIAERRKIIEGEFYFEELRLHLLKWHAPMFVNIHLDDTRIVNKVEYDPVSNRFVGFVLPLKSDGTPITDAFQLESFNAIKETLESASVGKYAHCIVVTSVKISVPSFVLFTLCTDSKYDNSVIMKRWDYVQSNLKKIGITVISNGADGAGPFLKAMSINSGLFNRNHEDPVLRYWSFYWMPKLLNNSLSCQDVVHLLAKLRTRLLTPSNLIVMGDETACRGHLQKVLELYSKGEHQLSLQILENKDKQNYESIEHLVSEGVSECLSKLQEQYQTKGTIAYLWIMKCIRDAFFDKALSPIKRLSLMWEVVFFLRIWRMWLYNNNYSEADHFITQNAYICIELNSHLLINVICNVIQGHFPKETLRLWTYGSQGCEQTFRLLRSMTSTFSTIVNFTLKGKFLFT